MSLSDAEDTRVTGVTLDEFEAKAVYWTSEIVNARLEDTFPPDQRTQAALALAGLVGEDPSGDEEASDVASCRLMLDALFLSDGDLARLALWVEAGRSDPRDLVAAAEYPRQLQARTDDNERADLAEYVSWVRGKTAE